MRRVGEVKLIINSKFAVIATTEPLILGSEVLVGKNISFPDQQNSSVKLTSIFFPKGKLKVVLLHSQNIYLVSLIPKSNSVGSNENIELAKNLTLYRNIFTNNFLDLDINSDLADYSAKLVSSNQENLSIKVEVEISDLVYF